MRILIVEPDSQAGNWHYATALASSLGGLGLTVEVATLVPVEPVPNLSSLHVVSIGRRPSVDVWPVAWTPIRLLYHVGKIVKLSEAIRRFKPQIVHLHGSLGRLDGFYFRYLRRHGIRVCYTTHWLESLDTTPGKFEIARHQGADALFVHSADGAARLRTEGIADERIWEITHGNFLHLLGDPISPAEAKARIGLPAHSRVLLFFGLIEPRKGLDVLIEAVASLVPLYPELWLVIAGAALGSFDAYKDQIAAHGIQHRVLTHVRYIPFEDLPTYFSAAEIVALPYRRIVQSGVLQLAYGFGRAVVVSNVGGIAESVREDDTGVVARSAQASDLADAIDALLRSPERAAQMGQRGRLLAETKYSWKAVAEQMAAAYRMILDRGSGM